MNNINAPEVDSQINHVLKLDKALEKHGEMQAGIPHQAWLSQSPNISSIPKNVEHSSEKLNNNHTEVLTKSLAEKLKNDLATLTAKSLMIEYSSEYSAWKNAKSRAKKLKVVSGKTFDSKFNSFVSFLQYVGPKPDKNDSLDRIDPDYGYVEANVRWASKQLQSENRKIVKEFEVNGIPMTLTKLSKYIGISYDALRMRLKRGERLEKVISQAHSSTNVNAKSANISKSPWPSGKEDAWEETFKLEASKLCPSTPNSRCHFYIAKCNQKLESLSAEAYPYGYEPLPAVLIAETNYWMELRADASKKLDLAIHQEKLMPSLGPTKEEIEMRLALGL